MTAPDGLNFLEFIQDFRRGELLERGNEKLSELIAAIQETGQGGSLTVKWDFKPNKAGQLEVVPVLTVKKPTRSMGTGIYFPTDDACLTKRDPNQMDFEDELAPRRAMES